MRYLFSFLFIGLLSFGLLVNEASAKRFGGGRSFGVQRSTNSLFSHQKASPTTGQKPSRRQWGGLLGGLLIGGLLTSLLMGHGLASGLLTWLILGTLVFFLVGFFRKRMQPASASPFFRHQAFSSPTNQYEGTAEYPPGFQPEQFLREAKICFMRLQSAYDKKNIQDLSTFTAPEVFGEIKMQLDERGEDPNITEVIELQADLLDVSKQFDSTIASVRFTGSIKENENPVTALNEIWHFRQFGKSKEWLVGGIQQEVLH